MLTKALLTVVASGALSVAFFAESTKAVTLDFNAKGNFASTQDPSSSPPLPDLTNGSFEGAFSYDSNTPDLQPGLDNVGVYELDSYAFNFFNENGDFEGTIRSLDNAPQLDTPKILLSRITGDQWLYSLSFQDFLDQPPLSSSPITPSSFILEWQITATDDSLPVVSPDDLGTFLPGSSNPPPALVTGSALEVSGIQPPPDSAGGIAVTSASVKRTPEPNSVLSFLAFGTLSAASIIKRKLKLSKIDS